MAVHLHEKTSPAVFAPDAPIAVDTEAMGLIPGRDRLCLVQIATAAATSIWSLSARTAITPRPTSRRCWPTRRGSSCSISRASIWPSSGLPRRHGRPALLHPDRLPADPHLHRPSRPEGAGQELLGTDIEAAAVQRLGRPESTMRSANMPPATSLPSRMKEIWTSGSLAKTAPTWPSPASISFLRGRCSTSPAGPKTISSRSTFV